MRLFLDDQELDVNQGFSNQITYAVDDLQNLDSKATAFSKTIVLPGTANNNRLLGNIFEFGAANFTVDGAANVGYNFNASRSAKMKMDYNGVQVIKGTLRLLEIIVDGHLIEFEIALFGELGGFFAKLGNKKIEELDFAAYNHTYNVTNITNSWDNANAGTGYYYPLIDYGNVSTDKQNYDYRAFRPALFVKDILNKIITGNGYTWESNFFNTNFAKRLIIPNNQDRLTTVKTQAFSANITGQRTRQSSDVTTNLPIKNAIGSSFNIYEYNSNGEPIKYQYNGTNSDYLTNIYIEGYFALIHLSSYGFVRFSGYLSIWKNGIEIIDSKKFYSNDGTYYPNQSRTFTFNYSYFNTLNYTTNDIIEFRFTRFFITSYIDNVLIIGISSTQNKINISSPVPIVLPAELNDTISINSTLPLNIKQKDFFASILKMFYLMVTEDKMKDRHFIIEPWVDFYDNNRTTYLDWSDKIQRDEPIRIKPMAELNARYYQLNYKSDNDWKNEEYRKLYNEGYGDRIYDNGFEFAKETDKTEVIFSATTLIGYTISNVAVDKIVSGIYKKNNGLEQQVASNIRILQANKLTGYSNWFIQNRTPSSTTNLSSALTTYGYAGHFDDPDAPNSDLNFGATKELYYELASGALSNNLFNAYYSSYMAEITDKDSRVITVKMRLTESDIYNLDFGRYILIDQVLYRLSKIIDYVPGELCKVQLLRVISTNYN
jgi:hypothetical protein